MRKILFSLVVMSFLIGGLSVSASHNNSETVPTSGVGITPDSPFYIFKTLQESIQTFFTFGEENKAGQYLHLADVRLAEYQKMLEKGKTDIAQKTLDKYEKQLYRAINKVEELKNKGKDVKDISEEISNSAAKHIQVLEGNLQKVPEAAKKGLERAIENAKKEREKVDETAGDIFFISPQAGKVGDTIELRGVDFSGFEGDLIAIFKNAAGVTGIIRGGPDSNNNLIKLKLLSSLCTEDTSYSGLPCPAYLNLVPGVYKVYVAPWGKKSNEVDFMIK